jgi:protein-S-isoprenylcysteine O-methyltransferase Ste14
MREVAERVPARLRRCLVWGDVAFHVAVLAVALVVAPRTGAWFVGVAAASIAFPLWIVSRLQLGSAFSFAPEARHLVRSGLYSRMRHPVYVFGTLASLSGLLALQVWPLLAIEVALIPLTLFRIRREEQSLEAAFGRQYDEYRRRTWF